MLSLKGIENLSLKTSSTYQILYQLQVIESLVNEFQTKRSCEVKAYFSEPLIGPVSSNEQSSYPSIGEAYNAPKVADSSVAIPMPPPTNIPEPPAPKVPFIGPMPPPSHNSNNN